LTVLPSEETSFDGPGSDDSDDSGPDDSGNSQNVAFEGIHEAICQLDQLAISIRLSSTSILTRRVNAFAERKTEDLISFETAALLAVENLYPEAAESLHRQLSKSMTDRYARLLYWKFTVVSETESSTAICQTHVHLPTPTTPPRGGASSVQINKVEYPRPPKLEGNEDRASCEFCRKIHGKEQYEDTSWWR
jgi:hypothetical protein